MIFLKIWEITALPVAPNFQMFTYKSLNKLERWMLLPFGINTTALNSSGTHANKYMLSFKYASNDASK